MPGYLDDLCYVHQRTNAHAERCVPGILQELKCHKIVDGLIVDIGCGGGDVCARFHELGFRTLGIDLSEAFVRQARARHPGLDFRVGSFLSEPLPSCQVITAIGEVFNYAIDPTNDWSAFSGWLRRAWAALQPGGLLIFDVAGPGRCPAPVQLCSRGEDWALLADVEEDSDAGILTRDMTVFRLVGEGYRRTDEVHRLHLFEPADVMRQLQCAGFEARAVDGFGSEPFPLQGLTGFVAAKPCGSDRP